MFFDPLSTWFVLLISNLFQLHNEKSKCANVNSTNLDRNNRNTSAIKKPRSGPRVIEKYEEYHADCRMYGMSQADQWYEDGKYNYTEKEREIANAKIKKKYEDLYRLGGYKTYDNPIKREIDAMNARLDKTSITIKDWVDKWKREVGCVIKTGDTNVIIIEDEQQIFIGHLLEVPTYLYHKKVKTYSTLSECDLPDLIGSYVIYL